MYNAYDLCWNLFSFGTWRGGTPSDFAFGSVTLSMSRLCSEMQSGLLLAWGCGNQNREKGTVYFSVKYFDKKLMQVNTRNCFCSLPADSPASMIQIITLWSSWFCLWWRRPPDFVPRTADFFFGMRVWIVNTSIEKSFSHLFLFLWYSS